MVRYFGGDGRPSAIRAQDSFRFYQEDGSAGFGTFPITYSTPAEAHTVRSKTRRKRWRYADEMKRDDRCKEIPDRRCRENPGWNSVCFNVIN